MFTCLPCRVSALLYVLLRRDENLTQKDTALSWDLRGVWQLRSTESHQFTQSVDNWIKFLFEEIYFPTKLKKVCTLLFELKNRLQKLTYRQTDMSVLLYFKAPTPVYLINVQHILLIFWKNPACMVLFHPARFINFWKFARFFGFSSNKLC